MGARRLWPFIAVVLACNQPEQTAPAPSPAAAPAPTPSPSPSPSPTAEQRLLSHDAHCSFTAETSIVIDVIVDVAYRREPADATAAEPSLCAGRCRFLIECPRRRGDVCTGHVTSLDHVEKHNRVPAVDTIQGVVSSLTDTVVVLTVHGGTLTQNLVTGAVDFTARAAAAVTPGVLPHVDTWQGRGQCPPATPAPR